MNFYEDFVIKSSPTGSNYICNPPVNNTDIDTVILVKEGYEPALAELGREPTLVTDGSDETYCNNGDFKSWRKGNKNYIVTSYPDFYKKFVIATKAAKALNLLNKEQRIYLFTCIFDAQSYVVPGSLFAF